MYFTVSPDYSENRRKQKEIYLPRPCQRSKKKIMEHEGDGDTNFN